jgi:hypothetical protein
MVAGADGGGETLAFGISASESTEVSAMGRACDEERHGRFGLLLGVDRRRDPADGRSEENESSEFHGNPPWVSLKPAVMRPR